MINKSHLNSYGKNVCLDLKHEKKWIYDIRKKWIKDIEKNCSKFRLLVPLSIFGQFVDGGMG